ncbi:hypothetical protein Fmac_001495 [Flemingia macrophylla]|uniref:Uncharacterized protein n=1 Tax=Flemingia macrophylla TaxID=520843 RepID=A0ABD1NK26_9FABA
MALAPQKEAFIALHLSCAGKAQSQSQEIVKLHRVFLSSEQASAPIHGLTTLQRPVFLVNSRPGLVTATPFVRRHPVSRSYGAILLSSLERVVSCP